MTLKQLPAFTKPITENRRADEIYPMRNLSRLQKLGYPAALCTEKPRTETITATTLITGTIRVVPRRQQRSGKVGVVS